MSRKERPFLRLLIFAGPWAIAVPFITVFALAVMPLWAMTGVAAALFGGLLNLAVILANRGYMPAAMESGQCEQAGNHGIAYYRPIDGRTRLRLLSDCIHLGSRIGLISPGDVLIFLGVLTSAVWFVMEWLKR